MGRVADFLIHLIGRDDASDVIDEVADKTESLGDTVEVPIEETGGAETAEVLDFVGTTADDINASGGVVLPIETPGAPEAISSLDALGNASTVMGQAGLTGASGLSAITSAITTGGMVAAVGAGVAVAKQSVDAFVALGRESQNAAAAVGMTTEEYSRWVAVADDAGVASSAVTQAFSAMNRSIAQGGEEFHTYGIATHDAAGELRSTNEVMLDVVGVLGAITDPTERAAAGTELLGRGYKNLAPLIGSTEEEMRGYLAAVEAGQVITAEEAKKADEMARAQDDLADSLLEVKLALGEMLVALSPIITQLAEMIGVVGKVLGPVADLVGGIGDLNEKIKTAGPSIEVFGREIHALDSPIRNVIGGFADFVTGANDVDEGAQAATAALDDQAKSLLASGLTAAEAAESLEAMGFTTEQVTVALAHAGVTGDDLATSQAELAASAEEAAAAEEAMAAAAEAAAEAEAALVDALNAEVEALQASVEASQEKADAMRAAADAQFAVTDAQADFTDALAGSNEAMKEAGDSLTKQQQVYDDVTQSAASLADETLRLAREQAAGKGAALSGAEAQDTWNRSMLESASKAMPEMQRQIVNYVAAVNGIPPEQVTAILTTLDQQGVDAAEIELANLSKTRDMAILADFQSAEAEAKIAMVQSLAEEPLAMPLAADIAAALSGITSVETAAAAASALVAMGIDPTQANAAIAAVTGGEYLATIDAAANTGTADSDLQATADAERTAIVDAEAETATADSDLLDLMSQSRLAAIVAHVPNWIVVNGMLNDLAKERKATITAVANTGAAEAALNNVARTRTAKINASVVRSSVLVRVDGGG